MEQNEDIVRIEYEHLLNDNTQNELILQNEQIKSIIYLLGTKEIKNKIFKFRSKAKLAKIIRKIYRKNKRLEINYFSLLLTKSFISFQEFKKITFNRSGLSLLFNENEEVVCVMFMFFNKDLIEQFEVLMQYIVNLIDNNETILNTKEELEEEIRKMIIIIKNIDDLKIMKKIQYVKLIFS